MEYMKTITLKQQDQMHNFTERLAGHNTLILGTSRGLEETKQTFHSLNLLDKEITKRMDGFQ